MMRTQEWRYTCGCQDVQRVSDCNNDMLFPTLARVNTKLRDNGLHIQYGPLLTLNSPLFITALKKSALLGRMCVRSIRTICLRYGSKITLALLQASSQGSCRYAPCNDCLTKAVFTCDRSIYYANYKCSARTGEWRESFTVQGLSFAGASNRHSKQMLSSNWFKMWHQRKRLSGVNKKCDDGKAGYFKGRLRRKDKCDQSVFFKHTLKPWAFPVISPRSWMWERKCLQ